MDKMELSKSDNQLFGKIAGLLNEARKFIVKNVNQTIVLTYFEIGKLIVEEEQEGKERAEYGKSVLKELSQKLTDEFGKGYSVYNLERMRNFYLVFRDRIAETEKSASVMRKSDEEKSASMMRKIESPFNLSWTHYLQLIKIENEEERKFYEIEAVNNNWSVRELERQYDSSLYERLVLSRDKEGIKELSRKGQVVTKPIDTIKEPYVLDFLGLEEKDKYTESDLETAIINKLEHFLTELGKGFLFVGRQQRITIEDEHFYVDLVFYNRLLQCFVLIDLKIGKLKHQDLGQMQMYVNYFDEFKKTKEENLTIGIVLCKQKNETLVRITLPKENQQIFASKYQTVLPSKEELKQLIENKE
ncbi:MAG: PDDEXK nuclease domain-containing protein [Candidatus Paceibacterota bacterium]|jgi:predicted nuclease of restriction endonuclease-like (RecB) superfamily|nr:PDDEXK nuclease domain-containing protein [Bacteroidales bacterium]